MSELDIKTAAIVEEKRDVSIESVIADPADIYIDPVLEKAALRKFDKFFLPQAFAFLVSSLTFYSRLRGSWQSSFSDQIEFLLLPW